MKLDFSIAAIVEITNGTLVRGSESSLIDEVSTDTRTPVGEHALFVALRGDNFDGHHFLVEAAHAGAVAAIVDRQHAVSAPFGAVIAVDDTLAALQQLAAAHRNKFAAEVVGITGSNGKTIVKEMLAAILGQTRTTYRSPGSYNSQVGVAHSLLGLLSGQHEVAIIEAGISQPGEMDRLREMIRPSLGAITNIGEAHQAGFGDLNVTADEKLRLFQDLRGPLIWNADDAVLRGVLGGRTSRLTAQLYGFGEAYDAHYRIMKVTADERGFDIVLRPGTESTEPLRLNVLGRHNVWNAAAAAAIADQLGVGFDAIRAGLADFEVAPMRMEMHTTQAGVTLLNDAYSSDPVSAAAALNALMHYAAGNRTVAIIGDMLDLGAASEAAHRDLGETIAKLRVDGLVCVGALARLAGHAAVDAGMAAERIWHVAHTDELHDLLEEIVQPGDFVLLKGSRAVGLEHAAQELLESVAPTRLFVDLGVVRDNVAAIRRATGTGLIAVIKSFAYGNDSNRVALTLENAGVDAFMVAFPDEGIPLRQRGIALPILVSNVRASEADKVAKYNLTAIISEHHALRALSAEAARRGVTLSVHVEVDTGMNRTGVRAEDALEFCRAVAERPHLTFDGLMTHFAAADAAHEDAFTLGQIATFERVIAQLAAADVVPRVVHAANTAAAWRFPQARYDLVRVGLGLYGVHPSDDVAAATLGLAPALTFVSSITQIRTVEPGASVGYGRMFRPQTARQIATVAVGYNDGFPRYMSSGGEVIVRGKRCMVVGNVCMDVCMIDVTDVPDAAPGDDVLLFGRLGDDEVPIDDLALRGRTISYEILTNISPRVRRIFRR